MPESIEAIWLREHWDEGNLGPYQNRWIAVRGQEIVADHEDLAEVIQAAAPQDLDQESPLYAFVFLGEMQ